MQQRRLRHFHIRESNACLPSAANAALGTIAAEDLHAFHIRCANERSDRVLLLASLWIGQRLLRHHSEESAERARGRPLLLAVDDVELAARTHFAARLLTACIATDIGFRQAERAERVCRHAWEILFLLRIVAEEHDRFATDRLMRTHEHSS